MQAVLQKVTRSLPWFVLEPAKYILGDTCYQSLVWDVNYTDVACLRLGLSKGLGLGIVVFGSIIKFPQIYKIVHARSAEGISLAMYILEVIAYTISLVYAIRLRIPFSTYGENASLTVQNMVITLLIIAYSPMDSVSRRVTTFCRAHGISTNALYVAIGAVLMVVGSLALISERTVAPPLLQFLQGLTIPVSLASKVPQMLELHRSKATGELSILVVFAQLLGTMARVFTTLTETNDRLLFWGFALATIFNAVIAVQVILYWNGNATKAARLHENRWFESPSTPNSRRLSELPLVAPRSVSSNTKRD
ncbi:hypothetical protein Malapachy_3641 [Malassezia pachydermatis]|uniref:Mannose-P-dolichol utilization defect 1 protein homolog n=1 Tax=Malassezia pachydermatis TaxID=77020 RepID=A0A0M8MQW3_9BASI|nr:hypothetical protein Malapachy_3641 [Malassezia pachydermatis]KOS16528.1 hypothetical protein Malapachy_3641 [Malassezia pachydermatis]